MVGKQSKIERTTGEDLDSFRGKCPQCKRETLFERSYDIRRINLIIYHCTNDGCHFSATREYYKTIGILQ